MSNSSFVYIHIYMYIYVHVSMYQMAPVDVAWSDLAKHCPWSKGQLIGMGSTVPLGTVPLVVIVIAAIVVKLGSKFAHFSRYLNETWWAQWSYA